MNRRAKQNLTASASKLKKKTFLKTAKDVLADDYYDVLEKDKIVKQEKQHKAIESKARRGILNSLKRDVDIAKRDNRVYVPPNADVYQKKYGLPKHAFDDLVDEAVGAIHKKPTNASNIISSSAKKGRAKSPIQFRSASAGPALPVTPNYANASTSRTAVTPTSVLRPRSGSLFTPPTATPQARPASAGLMGSMGLGSSPSQGSGGHMTPEKAPTPMGASKVGGVLHATSLFGIENMPKGLKGQDRTFYLNEDIDAILGSAHIPVGYTAKISGDKLNIFDANGVQEKVNNFMTNAQSKLLKKAIHANGGTATRKR